VTFDLFILEKGRSLDGWATFGLATMSLANTQPLSAALPAQMKLTMSTSSSSAFGFTNNGFYGIKVQPQNYTVSFYYRPSSGASVAGGKLTVGFRDTSGQTTFANATVDVSNASIASWSNYSVLLRVPSAAPTTQNTFFVEFPQGSQGDFEFNLISCFPPTFKDRPNGARLDIAQAFADLKPGYVRVPGGNDLEGPTIAGRFIWNTTIGPLQNRPGRPGTWTGYNTEGFGLIEFMTFVEDIGATALLAVYAGYSLNHQAVPRDQLQPYIDEVINEIDFLTASADDNPMGALRKNLGRAQPFDLKYVEIGNEDFINPAPSTYSYRWTDFYNALSQRYPNITFIATTTQNIPSPPAVDDHDYQVPLYFINNFRRYEHIPRPTPKVVAGEFAVISDDDSAIKNPWAGKRLDFPSIKSAVAESVYRIGFERNSDVIIGGCYAPVLQNIDNTQWTPNLLVFNANLTVRSTSYLAQQIFGTNLGNIILYSTATNSSMTHESVQRGEEGDGKLGNLYFIATKRTNDSTLILKLASVDPNDTTVRVQVKDSHTSTEGQAYILSAGAGVDPATVKNTIDNSTAASITTQVVSSTDGTFSITIPSWSVVVVTLGL